MTPRALLLFSLNLVVIVDRQVGAEKLALAKAALTQLCAKLTPDDRIGIIAVGDDELTQSGSDRVTPRLLKWIDALAAAKSDQEIGLGPPMEMAEGLIGKTHDAKRSDRVWLISDGAHVTGLVSDEKQRARVMALQKRGIRVDAASPFAPVKRPPLEALAELGGGRLVILRSAADLDAARESAPAGAR